MVLNVNRWMQLQNKVCQFVSEFSFLWLISILKKIYVLNVNFILLKYKLFFF